MKQHKTKLCLPFNEAWYTFWGGDSKKLNMHHGNVLQNYAFDFILLDHDGKSYTSKGSKCTDFHSFGRDIIAPADGVAVEAFDGLADNPPGTLNPYMVSGNGILIKHTDGEYSKFSHLRQGSVAVKSGDKVKTGDKLGECGNSGYTTQPHLHYHMQDADQYAQRVNEKDLFEIKPIAKGVKIFFNNIEVEANGSKDVKSVHSPIKGEIVKNAY